jgi:hypothetical protein
METLPALYADWMCIRPQDEPGGGFNVASAFSGIITSVKALAMILRF